MNDEQRKTARASEHTTDERPDISEVLGAAARAGDTDADVELYDRIQKTDAPAWLQEQLRDEAKEREFDEWLRRHFLLPGNTSE